MSSIHSRLGLPFLFLPFIIPNVSILILLSLFMRQMCPNNRNFLWIIFCIRFSFTCIFLYKFSLLTFCVHPILRIFLWHFLSKASIFFSHSFVKTHVSQPYSMLLNTHVFKTLSLVESFIALLFHILSIEGDEDMSFRRNIPSYLRRSFRLELIPVIIR